MKLTQIFGIVVLIHLGIVGVLLIQPGCQSQPRSAPDPSMTETAPQTTSAAAPRGSEPSRPTASTRTERRDLDSAFNAGLEPDGRGTAPSSPTSRTADRRTETSADTAGSGRLRPVVESFDDDDAGDRDTAPARTTTYTVQRGDTLTAIARREGVSLDDLLSANNLSRNSTIYAGQELRVPASGARADTSPAPAASRTDDTQNYTVVAGDNLTRIANRHGVTVAEIRRLNNLTSDSIRVGQTLRIPRVSGGEAPRQATRTTAAPSAPAPSNGQTYTVRSGDTPITIARRFGIEPDALMRANNISDPRRLFVGRELVIPGGGTSARAEEQERSPAPAPAPRAERPRDTPAAIPLRERPSQPAIIDQQPAERRAMTLDDLESLDDDDLRYVEVEDADGDNGN